MSGYGEKYFWHLGREQEGKVGGVPKKKKAGSESWLSFLVARHSFLGAQLISNILPRFGFVHP